MSIQSCGVGKSARRVYSLREVAGMLDISYPTAARVVAESGELAGVKAIQVGVQKLFPAVAIDKALDGETA